MYMASGLRGGVEKQRKVIHLSCWLIYRSEFGSGMLMVLTLSDYQCEEITSPNVVALVTKVTAVVNVLFVVVYN